MAVVRVGEDKPGQGRSGTRNLDVLANGVRIATEKLNFNRPGEFYDGEYELPPKVMAGMAVITVKFQAQPAQIAGGVYDIRVVKTGHVL